MESQRIRDEVRKIKPVPDPNLTIPDFYTAPSRILEQVIGDTTEYKLIYFCKHHVSDELATIINKQFAYKLFDQKGKATVIPGYAVTSSPPTNQLIVRCPTKQDVDAILETLEAIDVPPVQVRIDCIISEIYADDTLDWETTLEIGNLFGEGIAAGGSANLFGSSVTELIQNTAPLPAFPGASLREIARSKMGLKVGYNSTDHDFLALVDILESRGYLKIVMNPTLEVVNGKTASISSSEHVPLDQTFLRDREGFVTFKTEYVDVVDSLEITPHVYADGYIGLETKALLGSKSIPDGVKQIRIVSKREIYNKENRIRPGQSLVIGGIRKSADHTVVRGVPVLKDIPLLGVLFSSKDYENRAVETLFILTPTISSGGIPNREMVERLTEKHKIPDYSGLKGNPLNPFNRNLRDKERELKLQKLEKEHLEMAEKREQARKAAVEAQSEMELAVSEAEKAKIQKDDAEKKTRLLEEELKLAKQQAAAAKANAEKAATNKETAENKAKQAEQEAQQAKEKAKQALEDTEKVKKAKK